MKIRKRVMGLVGSVFLGALTFQKICVAAEMANTAGVEVVVAPGDLKGQKYVSVVQDIYEKMINQKHPEQISQYLDPSYIQHNPTIATGADALIKAFEGMEAQHPRAHVVVHRIIATGNYVYAHVNFINLFNDDPNDRGLAGVDIYRFDDKGLIVEHWDVLQPVPDPKTAANQNGMF